MGNSPLNSAVSLSESTGTTLITTADKEGIPHLSIAGSLSLSSGSLMTLEAWYCPGTISNLSENPNCTLTVWDQNSDTGYQIVAMMQKMEQTGLMDGFSKTIDEKVTFPQRLWKMSFKAVKIYDFLRAPHTDTEEPAL